MKGDEAKAKDAAPTDIEVKLPEGVEADAALLDVFKTKAKELGLDSAKAQGLLDVYVQAQAVASEKAATAEAQRAEAWAAEVKADKEFGGARLTESTAAARKAVAWAGGDALRQTLDEMGVGNNPVLFRAFARIGKALSEDSLATAGTREAPQSKNPEDVMRALYPTMFPKE